MKCFNHRSDDSIAICMVCGKALCPLCAHDLGEVLAVVCGSPCEDFMRALRQRSTTAARMASETEQRTIRLDQLLERNRVYFNRLARETRIQSIVLLILGIISIGSGIILRHAVLSAVGIVIGAIFLFGAWISFYRAKTLEAQGR